LFDLQTLEITHQDFDEIATLAILDKLLQKVLKDMHDKNPIAPIHKSLYGITKDPSMMHSLITKINCENLYIYKDKVIAS